MTAGFSIQYLRFHLERKPDLYASHSCLGLGKDRRTA